jgi:Family of unknown function (DUF6011)
MTSTLDQISQTPRPDLANVARQQSAALRRFTGRTHPGYRPAATATARPTYAQVDAMVADLPLGSYALTRPDGTVDFLEVSETRKGKWIRRLLGAPGEFRRVNLPLVLQFHAAKHIGADPKTAGEAFADYFTACWKCHSPLTDPESRARRLGPTCAKKA